jgi:hypothetical protein
MRRVGLAWPIEDDDAHFVSSQGGFPLRFANVICEEEFPLPWRYGDVPV